MNILSWYIPFQLQSSLELTRNDSTKNIVCTSIYYHVYQPYTQTSAKYTESRDRVMKQNTTTFALVEYHGNSKKIIHSFSIKNRFVRSCMWKSPLDLLASQILNNHK